MIRSRLLARLLSAADSWHRHVGQTPRSRAEHEQSCLVRQELADGGSLFPALCELGPVGGHAFFVVNPAPRVGDSQRHRCQVFGGRVDEHHGVLLPRLARLPVPDPAPEVDDLLAPIVGAAGAAQFPASSDVAPFGGPPAQRPSRLDFMRAVE